MPSTKRMVAAQTVNATATVTGAWFRLPRALHRATVTYILSSATGTPQVDITFHLAYAGDERPTAASTDYEAVSIAAGATTTSRTAVRPSEFATRARWGRVSVVGGAANPVDTVATVALTY